MIDSRRYPILVILERPVPRLALALLVLPALNVALNRLILFTSIPLFMDSIGTVLSTVLLGLPLGLATAVLTNGFGELLAGFPLIHLPFALCGMATALIVDALVKQKRFSTPPHFILATLLVALANSVLGAIIATFVFGGGTGVNIDVIVSGFALAFGDVFSAALIARVAVNIIDKSPAVFLGMVVLRALGGKYSGRPESRDPLSPPGSL